MSMGRPTLLTDELRDAAVQHAAAGIPREVIGPAIGIGRTTFFKWLRWGKAGFEPDDGEIVPDDLEPYQNFRDAIEDAQARPIVLCEATMLKAVQGTPAIPANPKTGAPAVPAVPPCPKTAERWLKMHRPDLYREQLDIGIAGDAAEAMTDALAATRRMVEEHAAKEAAKAAAADNG